MDRETLIDVIGPMPERPTLKSKIVESRDQQSFIQHKVCYLVEENELISAFLLIPKNLKKPAPGIVCHHQHASMYNRAKSEMVGLVGDPDLAYAKELAELGFVTIAADALPFEERNWHGESWWGVEYFELATRILQGKTLLSKVLSDISASIDCLMQCEQVDKQAIGFIGHSYGARMAIWAPVIDRRIRAAVSNCFCLNFKNSLDPKAETRIPMELCLPNFLEYGDVEDVVRLMPPCSLYLSVAKEDKWCRDAHQIYEYSKDAFDNTELRFKEWEGTHSFRPEMRLEAYEFLKEKLCVP